MTVRLVDALSARAPEPTGPCRSNSGGSTPKEYVWNGRQQLKGSGIAAIPEAPYVAARSSAWHSVATHDSCWSTTLHLNAIRRLQNSPNVPNFSREPAASPWECPIGSSQRLLSSSLHRLPSNRHWAGCTHVSSCESPQHAGAERVPRAGTAPARRCGASAGVTVRPARGGLRLQLPVQRDIVHRTAAPPPPLAPPAVLVRICRRVRRCHSWRNWGGCRGGRGRRGCCLCCRRRSTHVGLGLGAVRRQRRSLLLLRRRRRRGCLRLCLRCQASGDGRLPRACLGKPLRLALGLLLGPHPLLVLPLGLCRRGVRAGSGDRSGELQNGPGKPGAATAGGRPFGHPGLPSRLAQLQGAPSRL